MREAEPTTKPTAPVTTTTGSSKNVWGDVNEDGVITIADATLLLQHLGNPDKYTLSEQAAINADVYQNGDGLSGSDALSIQKFEAKVINKLPESYKEK